ncbi:hypothetical protein [Tateyamaria sp. syn59]|uniref:hypothetical protein n=1 Tax=Tateyamaria sp. syn59 TaxID=2576942 RepID=UPI00167816A9|nr:hypothetical protein [Tateyamaria sp. syn59]
MVQNSHFVKVIADGHFKRNMHGQLKRMLGEIAENSSAAVELNILGTTALAMPMESSTYALLVGRSSAV